MRDWRLRRATRHTAPDFTDDAHLGTIASTVPSFAPQDPVDETLSDDQVTGNIKLSWFINDSVLSYVSYATGYKSGVINMSRIDPTFDCVLGPETSRAIEFGLKADFPAFWGRNVLDKEYRSTGFDPVGSNGLVLAMPGVPAT